MVKAGNAEAAGTPAAATAMSSSTGRAKRRLRTLLGVALALSLVWIGLFMPKAWQATRLREAYLPELEQRAARQPANPGLLTLLAVRRCEARQYALADR